MKKYFLLTGMISLLFSSCEKYDDFIEDFDYSTAYFAYQNPVRTLFADDLTMKVGVAMGGKRENRTTEFVSFRIAPELLNDEEIVGSNDFELLPESYYTISDDQEIMIPPGEFVGTVTVNLNDNFLSDPLATENHYALPLLITETSLDSVLVGDTGIPRKDYSIVVVKYINEQHGIYYHRGVRRQFDASGNLIDELSYASNLPQEFVQNIVWDLKTVDSNTLKTDGIGEFTSSNDNSYSLLLTHNSEEQVEITAAPDSEISNIMDNGDSHYSEEDKTYYLNYQYTDDADVRNVMIDTLIFRNTGLELELW